MKEIQQRIRDRLPETIDDQSPVDPPVRAENDVDVDLVMYPPWEQVKRVLVDGSLASFGFKPDKYDELTEEEREYMIDVLMDDGVLPNILEAPKYTFYISGISKTILAQITRARIGAGFISVTSADFDQRDVGYVLPDAIKGTDWEADFTAHARGAYELYAAMIEDNGTDQIPLEQAREILPFAHHNYHIATFTYRSLLNLWETRRCTASQPAPWKYILDQMKAEIEAVHPPLGENLTWDCEECGYPYVMPWSSDFNQFPCEREDAPPEKRGDSGNFLYDEDKRGISDE